MKKSDIKILLRALINSLRLWCSLPASCSAEDYPPQGQPPDTAERASQASLEEIQVGSKSIDGKTVMRVMVITQTGKTGQ